jgi:ABC-type amino acid transport system permease subunit
MGVHDHLSDPIKGTLDVAFAGVTVAAVLDAIPGITAALSLVWVCMRIYSAWLEIKKHRRD